MVTSKKRKTFRQPHAQPDSRAIIRSKRSHEIFFAVVGPVGAGGTRVMASLKRACEVAEYACESIKASELIRRWAADNGRELPKGQKSLELVKELQDLGDAMREKDAAAVAIAAIREIAQRRAKATSQPYVEGQAVQPDTNKRAYLIESIRHPAEVHLLRRTYSNSFALIGVVREEAEREKRIIGKYFTDPERKKNENRQLVKDFMSRDADDSEKKHGQHVTDAFYEADFFVDNTAPDADDDKRLLDEPLARLISIISHDRIIRPSIEETAMHHAHSARVRSACLSRQVGAALVDSGGTVISTGVNEVPRAGGGVYGEDFSSRHTAPDHRCAFRGMRPFCSSNREQNKIVDELISSIPALGEIQDKAVLSAAIRKTRLGQLIEFSRAVHAEMDALLSAGREGISTVGTRLFVTTFPCHYCARHIVSAGVYEVQFIEPYPKSLAVQLHDDAIEVASAMWVPPEAKSLAQERREEPLSVTQKEEGKVLFHPFVGVAPRLYARAFEKTWRLKNKISGELEMEPPEWGDDWAPLTVAYPQLEVHLTRRE